MENNKPISTIAIISNKKITKPDYKIIKEILTYLKNFNIIINKKLAKNFKELQENFETKNIKEIYADAVLTFGGDGTILHSLRELPNNPLILGINFGNLGFLTELNKKNTIQGIKKLINNDFFIEKRKMLLINKKYSALNELVISGQFPANLLNFEINLNKKDKLKFRADGLIIATQTGSTTYSLSLGGPIAHPNANVFIITPINPFLQKQKSIVVNDKTDISVTVKKSRVDACLIIDGKVVNKKIKLNEKILIKENKKKAKFIRFNKKWKINKII